MKQGYSIRAVIAGMVTAAGLASSSQAQSIRAVIYSQPEGQPLVQVQTLNFPPNQPISVDISPWDAFGNSTFVHLFDSGAIGAVPTLSCGRLTVIRNGASQVNVLVGNGEEAVMPPNGFTPVQSGVLDFGGLSFVDSNGVDFIDLRTVVAVTAHRDITGSITAAEVRRVQARRDITGDIIGYGVPDPNDPTVVYNSVDTVLAGNLISGNITTLLYFGTGSGSINQVIVGPSPTASGGITGDITAPFGNIGSIFSAGEIGRSNSPIRIEAGNNIEQIRTVATNPITGVVELRPTDVHANIKAGTGWVSTPSAFSAVRFVEQGRLGTIEVGGILKGEIKAVNLGSGFGVSSEGRSGIVVRGPIEAPITVELNAHYSDIIGSVLRQPIVIGWKAKGSIVAYGVPTSQQPDLGSIKSIKIGYQPQPPLDFVEQYTPGFVGTESGPLNLDPRLNVAVGQPDRTPEQMWFDPISQNRNDNGALDSVIYARYAENIELRSMTPRHRLDSLKLQKPRIEVQRIDNLKIDSMQTGVVWSGQIQYATTELGRRVENDPSDDYASIGSLNIGCMSPTADVYFKDTPVTNIGFASSSALDGTSLGELHLPRLNSGETIRITNKFGAGDAASLFGSFDFECYTQTVVGGFGIWMFTIIDEPSPRGRDVRPGFISAAPSDLNDREPAVAPRASIRIADPEGLKGQIVVNTSNVDGLPIGDFGMWGQVRLKSDRVSPELDDVILAVDQNGTPFDAPLYTARAVLLGGAAGNGGGAIGQVPFSQKTQDSIPTAVTDINGNPQRYMPARSFNNVTSGVPVRVSYYGPLTNVSSSSVALEKFNDQTSTWSAVTSGYSVALDPAAAMMNRDILVRGSVDGAGDPVIQPGTYRVRVKGRDAGGFNVDANPVLCDVGQPFGANPPVMASTFEFTLTPRCLLGSGDPYPADIADDQGNPLWPNGIGGTANNINTAVNEGDYNLFFGANGFFFQSGLGTAAIGMFCDIANDDGSYPGDGTPFDPQRVNSGVNEGDYNAFFNTFFAGCSV